VLVVVAANRKRARRGLTLVGYGLLAAVLAFIVFFAVPAG
jgi:hypothetical protein